MELGPLTIGNSAGWYGLLSLIPFVIIYLIRPRPKKMEIPSLMFFLSSRDNPRQQSFFRNFARDWLFLVQLLIFLLFVFQLVEPFSSYEHDITSENTVIVMDVSASMQARRADGESRFSYGRDLAIKNLGKTNTIIMAGGTPKVLLKDATYDDAVETLKSMRAMDSPSAIGESLVLGGELLAGREGRVIGISDFLNTRGVETEAAKVALESRGVVVDFLDVTGEGEPSNVGIIDMDIDAETVTVFVRNFDEKEKQARVKVGSLEKDLSIGPQETETFSFGTPDTSLGLELLVDDDFDADNQAFVAVPAKDDIRVAVISNNDTVFLANAVASGQKVTVERSEPPLVPTSGYDVYIFSDIKRDQILPGTFEALREEVRKGASVVIAAQDGMLGIDYKGLLPIGGTGMGQAAQIVVDQETRFTTDMDFGSVDRYVQGRPVDGAISLASVEDNSTVLAFQEVGDGKVVYFGIIESASHFKLSPSYPIFWVKLLEYLNDQESIENLNHQTGETKVLDKVSDIKTPSTTKKQNVVLFEEAGFYDISDKRHAANLLDQAESTISPKAVDEKSEPTREVELKPVTETREFSFVIPLLIAACILVFLELLYVKVRGDL